MNVQTFITETLIQIREGVVKAQEQGCLFYSSDGKFVEFDVAVTVTEGVAEKGGGGVSIFNCFKVSGELDTSLGNSTVNRIKFCIPLHLPRLGHNPADDLPLP